MMPDQQSAKHSRILPFPTMAFLPSAAAAPRPRASRRLPLRVRLRHHAQEFTAVMRATAQPAIEGPVARPPWRSWLAAAVLLDGAVGDGEVHVHGRHVAEAAVGAMQRGFHALRSRVQTAAQPLLRDHYTELRNGRVVARITTATGYRSRARR